MTSRQRITFLLACTAAIGVGCGGSKREVQAAKQSVYDTDFAIVFSAALDATRTLYPSLDDAPGAGAIRTAWHQVQYANTQDDLSNQRTVASGQGYAGGGVSPAAAAAGMPTRLAFKRYFIRFDVTVAGGRPWRVKVVGHASEWEPGNALPTELHGPARPHWLEGRTDALIVAIYKQLRKVALPMKEEVPEAKPEDSLPKTDPKLFKDIPPAAGARLAKLKDAVVLRDNASLRVQLADDIVWSLGGAPGADTAMAMWQADPESLDSLVRVIGGGCAGTDKRVTCPGGAPVAGKWQLAIELRGDAWKVTSFVKAE
jgi:hypothetical protein